MRGLLSLALIALAFIFVAEEAGEVIDQYGVVALRPSTGGGDHPLERRPAIRLPDLPASI